MEVLPLSEARYCPDCGTPMNGPSSKAKWSCLGDPDDCTLISCKFDKFGKNPYDIKREGLTPIIGFACASTSVPVYPEDQIIMNDGIMRLSDVKIKPAGGQEWG